MSFDFDHEFKVKYEGVFDVVEAYGIDTVKMAFKNMKMIKKKMKKNGFESPRCFLVLTDADMTIKNRETNRVLYSCKICNISYVMSSLCNSAYIGIIVSYRGDNSYISKCIIVKTQYNKSNLIVSQIRDSLMRRHNGLLNTNKSDLPCRNCVKIFRENNLLKERIEELSKLIDYNTLQEYYKAKKIIELTDVVEAEEEKEKIRSRRTVSVNKIDEEKSLTRKTSCPGPNKVGMSSNMGTDVHNFIPLAEFLNWKESDPWNEKV